MDGFWPEVGLVFFFKRSGPWSEFFDVMVACIFSLRGPVGGLFLGGSSDSRLVSIVRDFLGKFLRGGLLIIEPFYCC